MSFCSSAFGLVELVVENLSPLGGLIVAEQFSLISSDSAKPTSVVNLLIMYHTLQATRSAAIKAIKYLRL